MNLSPQNRRASRQIGVLTVQDIVDDLGVSVGTVKQWIRDGKLKAMIYSPRAGYKIKMEDYQAFLDGNDKYYCKHVGLGFVEHRLRREMCGIFLEKLDEMEQKFLSEEHGASYTDGWNAAMLKFNKIVANYMAKGKDISHSKQTSL